MLTLCIFLQTTLQADMSSFFTHTRDDSDVDEVDEELAAALAMLEEDNTYAMKEQKQCQALSGWLR